MATANIETTLQLNKLIEEQNRLFAIQSKITKGQLSTMKAIADAIKSESVEKFGKSFSEINSAISDSEKAIESFGNKTEKNLAKIGLEQKKNTKGWNDASIALAGFSKKALKLSVVAGVLRGLSAGFQLVTSGASSLFDITTTLIGSFFELGKSILAAPFKILNTLMQEAAQGGGNELFEQMEQTRELFGSLSKNEGQDIIKSFRSIRGELANTGLSSYKVLGNLAERLEKVREIAVQLGRQFGHFSKEMVENAEAFVAYQKGLGLSEDGLKAMGKRAIVDGKNFTELGRQVTQMAFGMGDAFDINGKLISRDISEMIGDFENFGSVSIKEMTAASVYTRKLGIDLKELLGVVAQFDTFESAAKATAQLSQAFGAQLDTLELVKEQDPAKRFESIRKSFMATGRSVENLNRQELKLLSSTTGLSAEAIKLGFAQKNQGVSYDDILKKSEKTEKKQISQADAIKELSDSIRVLVKSGSGLQGGFFDIFLQGFDLGFRRSQPFVNLMRNMTRSLYGLKGVGRMVGREFAMMFPGIKEVLNGISSFFDAKTFGRISRGGMGVMQKGTVLWNLRESFRTFFVDVKDGKYSLGKLMDNLKKTFFSYFDGKSEQGSKILNGFKSLFTALGGLAKDGLVYVTKGMTDLFKNIKAFIENPKGLTSKLDPSSWLGMLSGFFEGIVDDLFGRKMINGIVQPSLVDNLVDAFMGLFNLAMTKLGGLVKKWWESEGTQKFVNEWKWPVIGAISAALFGPAIIGGLVMAAGVSATKLLGKVFDVFANKIKSSPTMGKNLTQAFSQKTGKLVVDAGANLQGKIAEAPKMDAGSIKSFFGNMATMAGGIIVGGVAMATAIVAVKKIIGNMDERDILKSLGIITVGAVAMLPMAVSMKALSAIKVGNVPWAQLAVGIAGLGAVSLAMVLGVKGLTHLLRNTKMEEIELLGASMRTIGEALLIAGGVILGATGVGMLMLTPGLNIAFAAAFATGAAALTAMVATLVGSSIELSKEIKKMNFGPDFKQKLEMFLPVMKAVGDFAGVAVEIMKVSKPSFGGLLQLFNQKEDQTMAVVTLRVKDLIVSMMDSVKQLASSLASVFTAADPNKFTAGAEGLSRILTGIFRLAGALKPPEDMGGFLGIGGKDLKEITKHLEDNLDIFIGSGGLIQKLTAILGGDLVNQLQPEKIAALSGFMTSIADVAKSFEQIGDIGKVKKNISYVDLNVFGPLTQVLEGFAARSPVWEMYIETIEKSFVSKIGSGVKAMVSEVNMIADEISKIEKIDVETSLKSISDKLGLTGNEQIRLAKRDLNLTVNANIKIDAVELEKILIDRPGSRFATNR